MKPETIDEAELGKFRAVQRLAYDCATAVAAGLSAGVSEREAAARLGHALAARGIHEYFHRPFAWFGARATFADLRQPLHFFPTERRLEPGMAGILDVAPIVDGVAADIGYTFRLGENAVMEAAMATLRQLRRLILDEIRAGHTMAEVYRRVDELIADHGFVNCHQKYPFGVLAHRVPRLTARRWPHRLAVGLGAAASSSLLGRALRGKLLGAPSPFWNRGAAEPPEPGVWAVEPHIGRDGVGAKWEELLVVTDATAYWLDDTLPHVVAA
jgi:Xaa-Pro aminopeptidase